MHYLYVKAEAVEQVKEGVFRLLIPSTPLPAEKAKVLDELYPHLLHMAHGLLAKESLLASAMSETEIVEATKVKDDTIEAPPKTTKGPRY